MTTSAQQHDTDHRHHSRQALDDRRHTTDAPQPLDPDLDQQLNTRRPVPTDPTT